MIQAIVRYALLLAGGGGLLLPSVCCAWINAEFIKVWENTETEWVEPKTGMVFVRMPGGCFSMGGGGEADEHPVHQVCVDAFYMGKFEVKNAEYRRYKPNHDSGKYKGHTLNSDDQPVVKVNWNDARAFARWLSNLTGHRFRLPREAEWEYACGCGEKGNAISGNLCASANGFDLTAADAFKNGQPVLSLDCSDGFAVTAPVGRFKPNCRGLYDMLGNVWEWCADTYATPAYRLHEKRNPVFKGDGYIRVRRGGAWYLGGKHLRCTNRHYKKPGHTSILQGFRVVMLPGNRQ